MLSVLSAFQRFSGSNGQRVAMRQEGVVYYIHSDHLGSTSLTTDQRQQVEARQLYHPYGTPRWSQGTLPTDYTFTGQRLEAGLGLMHYGARFYSPRLGRFVSADTIVPEPGEPQALNRYAYVQNNPLRYIDPSGHYIFEDDPRRAYFRSSRIPTPRATAKDWGREIRESGDPYRWMQEQNEKGLEELRAWHQRNIKDPLFARYPVLKTIDKTLSYPGVRAGIMGAMMTANPPIEPAAPSGPIQDSAGRWRNPDGTFARDPNAPPIAPASEAHGNSLDSLRPTTLYELMDKDTGQVMKYGITSEPNPLNRYGSKWLEEYNVDLIPIAQGQRWHMYQLEKQLNVQNNSPWSVHGH
jgi:RHS repeat-associated protein